MARRLPLVPALLIAAPALAAAIVASLAIDTRSSNPRASVSPGLAPEVQPREVARTETPAAAQPSEPAPQPSEPAPQPSEPAPPIERAAETAAAPPQGLRESSDDLTIAGRVVDETGAPVTMFRVEAKETQDSRLTPSGGGVTTGFYEEDGRFQLHGLKEGVWQVTAQALRFESNEPVLVKLPAEGAALTLVLIRCATISGVVVDTSGKPIVNATVETVRHHGRGLSADNPRSLTDERGAFTIASAPSGALWVFARHESYVESPDVDVVVAAGGHVDGVRLVLGHGGSIRGAIDPSVASDLSAWSVSIGSSSTETDATGHFAFDRVPPGKHTIVAQPPHDSKQDTDATPRAGVGPRLTATTTVVEGETVHVVLGAPLKDSVRVTGTVRRAGRPVANALVEVWRSDSPNPATTGDDGRYELTIDRAGDWEFTVDRGGAHLNLNVAIPSVASYTLDFDLPTGRIAGHVIGSDGTPVKDAWVLLEVDAMTSQGSSGLAQTDGNGAFAFDDVAPGVYEVSVFDGAAAATGQRARFSSSTRSGLRLDEGEVVDGLEIRVDEPASIEGTVRNSSNVPVIGANVQAYNERGELADPRWREMSDGAGRYRLDGLAAGVWTVRAGNETDVSDESAPVRLAAGSTATVDLMLRRGTVLRVIVEDANGKVVDAAISIRLARGSSFLNATSTDGADGRTFGPLLPGTYEVTATNDDGASASARVTLRGEAQREIGLRFGGQ